MWHVAGCSNHSFNFAGSITDDIVERSPYKYGIVCNISCLVLSNIAILPLLVEIRIITGIDTDYVRLLMRRVASLLLAVAADRCQCQFTDLTSSSLKATFSGFSRSCDRLGAFYYDIIDLNPQFSKLFAFTWFQVPIKLHRHAFSQSSVVPQLRNSN